MARAYPGSLKVGSRSMQTFDVSDAAYAAFVIVAADDLPVGQRFRILLGDGNIVDEHFIPSSPEWVHPC